MLSRIRISLLLALLVSLAAAPALAGGWAVITLDELPSNVVAGEPFTIGFTVRQHGVTPMAGITPTITANLSKDEQFSVFAKADDKVGHYTATLTFPKDGEWQWSIQAFTMDQKMPALTVMPAIAKVENPPVVKTDTVPSTSIPSLWIISGLALVVGIIGGAVALRRRNRLAVALTAACLLAGVALPIAGASRASTVEAKAEPESKVADVSSAPSLSQEEMGKQLFIAKGCITCHYNSKAGSPAEYWTIEMGAPNLSNFSADPKIIFMRLKDPASVKSDTKMPQLELKEHEIEALVAFINSK